MLTLFNMSAEDLELFTVEPKLLAGSRRAAVAISAALQKLPEVVGAKVAGGQTVRNSIYEALQETVRPLLTKYAKYGASDTEPETVITERVEMHFGVPEYSLDRFEW